MGLYSVVLVVSVLACIAVSRSQHMSLRKITTTSEFDQFQRTFLSIYLLATSADWIQGPHLYKLYSFYGFTKAEIGFLFVSGFLSSAAFGTILGGLADQIGRKKMCIGFCILYSLSCLTKHSRDFNVLLIGRGLGGASTSILFSVFEAWMLHEHKRNAYPDEWLVKTLSYMTFVSSVGAVVCAVVAEGVTSYGGYVAPFDTAVVFLVLAGLLISKMWRENYGDQSVAPMANFAVGWVVMASNPKIWVLGLIQSCFEGAMYLFVFSWTPILEDTTDEDIPHGVVFASFMVSIMIGTWVYQAALKTKSTEQVLQVTALVAAGCLSFPAISLNHDLNLIVFCMYEICIGIYFPAIAYLRSKHIPEEVRATILNFFRIPLNLFVVMILLNIAHMSTGVIALWSAGIALLAFAGLLFLVKLTGPGTPDLASGAKQVPEGDP